jgi:hypothetical protein
MGPRVGLDAAEKIKFLPFRESNPGRPTHSLSIYSWERGVRLVVSYTAFKICSCDRIPLGAMKYMFRVYFGISGFKYWTEENIVTRWRLHP